MNLSKHAAGCSVRRFLRLLFYFAGIFAVFTLFTVALCACSDTDADNGDNNAEIVTDVTFILNNGEPDVICDTEDSVPLPVKSGYYLYGWYADEDLTVRIAFDTIKELLSSENLEKFIDGEYKLYARWEKLKEMSGVRIRRTEYIYDGKAHTPEIEGLPQGAEVEFDNDEEYIDAGEYLVSATVRAYGYKDLRIEGALVINKAHIDFTAIRFDDSKYTWDGSEKRIEVTGELPYGVTVSYENNGKTDAGEYEVTAVFEGGRNYISVTKTARLIIEAKSYKVTLVEEDGSFREISIKQGEALGEIPTPKERRGYIGKWSIEDFSEIREDTKVYAVYELAKYTIEYDCAGGELAGGAVTEYTIKDEVILTPAEREYYIFEGWYDNSALEGEEIKIIERDSIGARKYYAKWKEREYTVRYEIEGCANDAHNVNRGNEYVYTVGSEDLELKGIEKLGYRFVGWKDENGESVSVITGESPRDMKLYGEWELIRYSIRYELNGGENDTNNPTEYTIEDEEKEISEAHRDGYEFGGWYMKKECIGETVEYIYGVWCIDIVLYAKWIKI